MKASTPQRIAKTGCLTAIVIAAILNAQSASAISVGYSYTLTEVSSTVLTGVYTGPGGDSQFHITNMGIDLWTIQKDINNITINLQDFEYNFLEPENPITLENNVSRDSENQGTNIFVRSDFPIEFDSGYFGTTTQIGTDGGVPIFLFFNDLAAPAEAVVPGVPEGGSSLGFLALSVTGFVALRRFRRPQPA